MRNRTRPLQLGTLVLLAVLGVWIGLRRERPRDPGVEPAAATTEANAPIPARETSTDNSHREPDRTAELIDAPEGARSSLRGAVRDATGQPIAGARLSATAERAGGADCDGTSGPDGEFELQVTDSLASWRVLAQADGFFAGFAEGVLAGGPTRDIVLRPAPILRGRVEDRDGAPIAGARVRSMARTRAGAALSSEALSDAKGEYRLPGTLLATTGLEDALLDVRADGFAPSRVALADAVLLAWQSPELSEVHRDIVLSAGIMVRGRVVDPEGAPLEGVLVEFLQHAGRAVATDPYTGKARPSELGPTLLGAVRTDAEGAFQLEHLPARTGDGAGFSWGLDEAMGSLRASAPGFAQGGAPVPWIDADEELPPFELVLSPAARVRGRAVDPAGQPLAGTKVWLWVPGFESGAIQINGQFPEGLANLDYWRPAQADTVGSTWFAADDDGRFVSPPLPCDGYEPARVEARLIHATGHVRSLPLELRAGETVDLGDVVIPATYSLVELTGVVQDEDGVPIAGALLDRNANGEVRRTDRDGRFSFEFQWAPEGEPELLELEVSATSYVDQLVQFTLPPDGELAIELERGRTLTGKLIYVDGTPAAYGRVSFKRPPAPGVGFVWSDMIGGTQCDAEGRFRFAELPAPPWVVTYRMQAPGVDLRESTTIEAPLDGALLRLPGYPPETVELLVSVTKPDGDPFETLWPPSLEGEDVRLASLRRNAREFVFPAVPIGEYLLRVAGPDTPPYSRAIELRAGDSQLVTVVLAAGAPVRGVVEPAPLRARPLFVVADSSATGSLHARVAADGRFDFGTLAAGAWSIGLVPSWCESGPVAWLDEPLRVAVDVSEEPLELRLPRPALGVVRLALPLVEADDPPFPQQTSSDTQTNSAWADQHQAWYNAYWRYRRRARTLVVELLDEAGALIRREQPDEVELDAERQRVFTSLTVPAGAYTLVLRRGDEVLRREPVQVPAEGQLDLDP